VARIEATPKGLDVRYVVTSLKAGARHLYETLYCARGNAENLVSAPDLTRQSSIP
jgi:Transposase DDE domain group 1